MEGKKDMKRYRSFSRNPIVRIVLALLLVISLTGCSGAPEAVSEPASGTVLSGYAPEDGSQLTVSVAPTASSVVMLKDTSGRTLMSFFVRSGDTVRVNVPAEKMYVLFASGKTWYGEETLFGKDTVYTEDEELVDFVQYNWEYELDPLSDGSSVRTESENRTEPTTEPTAAPTTAPTAAPATEPPVTTVPAGYIGDLDGEWESVHLQDGNSSLKVYAMAFSETIYNCTEMTILMNVTMNAGTSCKDWQVWGRSGNSFVKIAKIYLDAGDGYTSQTITFDKPVTFNAIAITPTVPGGYSWSMGLAVTDVWVKP